MIFDTAEDYIENTGYFKKTKKGYKLDLDLKIIDAHTHLGLEFPFLKRIDYYAENKVRYELPTDIPLDTELFTGRYLMKSKKAARGSFFKKKGKHKTHTVTNLINEMNLCNIEKSLVLPVDLPLKFHNTKKFLRLEDYDKLIYFCSINPINVGWRKRMKKSVEQGAKGLKIHPYTIMSPPNKRRTMKLINEWSQYNLPVIFHSGFSGLEPRFTRKWLELKKYERPIKFFKDTKFILGHSGCIFYKKAIALARKYPNVYLELSGQYPESIRKIIKYVDNDRILFGSDWPFYPIALPLAKTLRATEHSAEIRKKILYDNARKILNS